MYARSIFAVLAFVCLPVSAQSTPDKLWDELQAGNRLFVNGDIAYADLDTERGRLEDHQSPPVTILSCADSRVPPELVFGQSLGDLFVIRAAGNTADTFSLASIEYAIARGYTKLVVVLGHENCGAVKAALAADDPASPNLLALVQRIRASFVEPHESVQEAVEANTRAAAALLAANSRIVRDAVRGGNVKIVPAYYDLGSGVVRKLE
jgi:carbonic anhydrase